MTDTIPSPTEGVAEKFQKPLYQITCGMCQFTLLNVAELPL